MIEIGDYWIFSLGMFGLGYIIGKWDNTREKEEEGK